MPSFPLIVERKQGHVHGEPRSGILDVAGGDAQVELAAMGRLSTSGRLGALVAAVGRWGRVKASLLGGASSGPLMYLPYCAYSALLGTV